MKKELIIDTVNYDYPSCGGIEVYLYSDGDTILIRHYSNYSGNSNGGEKKYRGYKEIMANHGKTTDGLNTMWNDTYTIKDMLILNPTRLGFTPIMEKKGHIVR